MKETFIVRTEWFASISKLSEIEQSAILKNLFLYHLGEVDKLEFPTLSVELIWGLLIPNLVRNIDSYDKRRETSSENGKLGGRPIEKISSMDGKIVPVGSQGSHFIYLMYDTETNLYKIGETSDLLKRRLSIKRPTKYLRIITFSISSAVSCQNLEREVLIKYKNLVVSGDWLRLSALELHEIKDLINQNKPDNYPIYPIESLNDSVSVPVSDSVSGSVVIPETKDSNPNAEVDSKKKLAAKKKAFIPPTVEEVIAYFAEKGCNEKFARRSFEHYDVAGWKDVKGNPVASWKQKMLRWIDGATPDQKLSPPPGTGQKMKYNPVVGMIPDND